MSSKILTKDDILNARDIKPVVVDIPEWGSQVTMRGISGSERDAFEGSIVQGVGRNARMNTQNVRAKLVAMTIVDEKGARVFKTGEEVLRLGMKSAVVLDRLFQKAQELSGLSDEAVKELSEGLGNAQSVDSTSV